MEKKAFTKQVGVQLTAILIAALGAAAITFFQSVAAQTGICPLPSGDPTTAGALGALLKIAHWTMWQTKSIV